jgi:hypothetical protein
LDQFAALLPCRSVYDLKRCYMRSEHVIDAYFDLADAIIAVPSQS